MNKDQKIERDNKVILKKNKIKITTPQDRRQLTLHPAVVFILKSVNIGSNRVTERIKHFSVIGKK